MGAVLSPTYKCYLHIDPLPFIFSLTRSPNPAAVFFFALQRERESTTFYLMDFLFAFNGFDVSQSSSSIKLSLSFTQNKIQFHPIIINLFNGCSRRECGE
jgi:hypothetical protein